MEQLRFIVILAAILIGLLIFGSGIVIGLFGIKATVYIFAILGFLGLLKLFI